MNPNIEVITPVLWGVNSFYVKAGWTKELLPIPQPPDQLLTGSKDVSLTDNGIMVLHKESELYPTLKKSLFWRTSLASYLLKPSPPQSRPTRQRHSRRALKCSCRRMFPSKPDQS